MQNRSRLARITGVSGCMCVAMLAVSAAIALAGCTDQESSDDSGPLVQVAESTSTSGAYDVALLAHSPELTRGDYSMQYIVTNMADGTPVDGLTMTIVPWMPAMGHGTPIVPTITPLGAGTYQLDHIDLYMAGLWQLRTTATSASSDQIEPSLQVE